MRKATFILSALLFAPVLAYAQDADGMPPQPAAPFFVMDFESAWQTQFDGLLAHGTGGFFLDSSLTITHDDFAGATLETTLWDEELGASQAFLFVQSDVSRLETGWVFNMARKLGISPPNVGPLNLFDEYMFMRPQFLRSSQINTDQSSIKLNFMAKGADGLVIGASYGPRSHDARDRDLSETYQSFGNLYAAAARYDIGNFGISAGVVRMDNWAGGRHRYEYSIGTRYYARGFQFSAAWRHVPAFDADAIHGGVAYEFGPIEASLTHLASRADRDWAHVSMFSTRYRVNDVLAISASVGRESYVYSVGLGRTGVVAAAGINLML